MRYLLDVNALVAWGFEPHEFHSRINRWVLDTTPNIWTCSTTELGFVRILSQVARYGLSVREAQRLLLQLKSSEAYNLSFMQDDHDVEWLPAWVQHPKQITDGHLLELAKSSSAILATLDRRIPGAYMIPE